MEKTVFPARSIISVRDPACYKIAWREGVGCWVMVLAVFIGLSATDESFAQTQLSNQREVNAEDKNTWDFGKIKPGEILQHSFILKNETEKILNVKDINTSCGCTISEIKKRTLIPQESTEITVKFNSKGYSGPVKQFIYVNTDNLDNPVLRFIIKAEVIKFKS